MAPSATASTPAGHGVADARRRRRRRGARRRRRRGRARAARRPPRRRRRPAARRPWPAARRSRRTRRRRRSRRSCRPAGIASMSSALRAVRPFIGSVRRRDERWRRPAPGRPTRPAARGCRCSRRAGPSARRSPSPGRRPRGRSRRPGRPRRRCRRRPCRRRTAASRSLSISWRGPLRVNVSVGLTAAAWTRDAHLARPGVAVRQLEHPQRLRPAVPALTRHPDDSHAHVVAATGRSGATTAGTPTVGAGGRTAAPPSGDDDGAAAQRPGPQGLVRLRGVGERVRRVLGLARRRGGRGRAAPSAR